MSIPMEEFRVRPEHSPKSRDEAYQRVHFYVAKLSVTVSDQLQRALIGLRRSAYNFTDPAVQKLALKGYSDDEFASAVKEILCIWLHMEAMDQGGEEMPEWLLRFLRLAFSASDYIVARPSASEVMMSYEHCDNLASLAVQTSLRAADWLGFGAHSEQIAPALYPVLLETGPVRQQVLERALTLSPQALLSEQVG